MPEDKKTTQPTSPKPVAPQAAASTAATPPSPTPASATGKPKTNGLAIAAIILAFLFPIVGLILGIVALAQIKKNNEGGKGLAIASIIISIVITLVGIMAIFAAFFAAANLAKQSGVNYDAGKGTVSVTDKEGNTGSFGNSVSLPSGFPSDVPIYKPSTIRLAVKAKDGAYNVTFTTKDDVNKVNSWYETELKKQGWTESGSGGFSFGVGTTQTLTKGNQELLYVIYGDKNQYGDQEKTSVSLTVANKGQ
jgi:hypothetical protein